MIATSHTAKHDIPRDHLRDVFQATPGALSTRIRWILGCLALASVFAGLITAPVQAQGSDASNLRSQLERTDDILREVAEVVRQSVGERPRQLFSEARDVQLAAWDDFRADEFRPAAMRSQRARELAVRAAELAKSELRILDQVRQMLTENQELIERAREAIQNAPNPEASTLLRAGLDELARGQRAYADGRFRQAVRFSMFGRDLLQRAMRSAIGEADASPDRVREALAQTDEFLREARLAVPAGNELALGKLEEAERLQEEARKLLDDNRLRQARRLTQRARERAMAVLREVGAAEDHLDFENMWTRARNRLEDLRGRARNVDDPAVDRLLEQAESHLRAAREAARSDRRKVALANIQLASNLLTQAGEALR